MGAAQFVRYRGNRSEGRSLKVACEKGRGETNFQKLQEGALELVRGLQGKSRKKNPTARKKKKKCGKGFSG